MPETVSPKSGLVLLQERKELLAKFDSWKEASAELQNTKRPCINTNKMFAKWPSSLVRAEIPLKLRKSISGRCWPKLATPKLAMNSSPAIEAKNTLDESQTSIHRQQMGWTSWSTWQSLNRLNRWNRCLQIEYGTSSQSQIATFRSTLSGLARGQTVDDFLARIGTEDIETLSQRKDTIQNQKQEREHCSRQCAKLCLISRTSGRRLKLPEMQPQTFGAG